MCDRDILTKEELKDLSELWEDKDPPIIKATDDDDGFARRLQTDLAGFGRLLHCPTIPIPRDIEEE